MSFPRMSWHIGDYKKDTGHLHATGHGAYFMLCMHYWSTGGLPDNEEELARIACLTEREWKKWKPTIQKFFKDGWRHKRIDEELTAAKAKYEARASAGQKGGSARANAKQNPSNATAKSKQPITLTDNPEVGKGDDAREPLVSPEAISLADEIALIAGQDIAFVDPRWCGAAMHVSKWLREGWTREVILVGARLAMAKKRDGPAFSIKYFENEIAREVARQAAPLPTVKPSESQEIAIGQGHGQTRESRKSRSEVALQKLANYGSQPPADGDICEPPVQFLPRSGTSG